MPKCCHKLCKRSRKDDVQKLARSYLKREINIFQIIRMRRYLMRAIKELLPKKKRSEIVKRTKFFSIVAGHDGK